MKLTFLLLLLFPVFVFSQSVDPSAPPEFKFTTIDTVKESQAVLFLKAKYWLATTFNSSKSVIEMEDKDAGKIIGKGVFQYDIPSTNVKLAYKMTANFTLTINVKDDKFKLVLSDFINEGYSGEGHKINGFGKSFDDAEFQTFPYAKDSVFPDITKKAKELLESFHAFMKKPTDKFLKN